MRRAACPGSFDPLTVGHLDVVRRAATLFDQVVVAVGVNAAKDRFFTAEERVEMAAEAVEPFDNVIVAGFDGLLTDFCLREGVVAIVKGLRGVGDFEYELQMAQMNSRLTGVETVFVATAPGSSFVASSLVKEVAAGGGDISGLVPASVEERLRARVRERRG